MRALGMMAAVALLVLTCLPASAQESGGTPDGPPDGLKLMQRVVDRHFVARSVEDVAVALIGAKGRQNNMAFTSTTKRQKNGLMQNLIYLTAPGNVKGTALVTWLDGQGQSKQWLYLPSQIMTRQVAGQARTAAFLGTDFTFEDLQPLVLDDFAFAVTGSETVDGQDCWLLEVTPATDAAKRESGYSKRVLAVRKDIEYAVRVQFHDPRGRLEKTQLSHDLVNVDGDAWAANAILMETVRPEHKTLLVVRSRDTASDIPDSVFTERYVRDQQKQ